MFQIVICDQGGSYSNDNILQLYDIQDDSLYELQKEMLQAVLMKFIKYTFMILIG